MTIDGSYLFNYKKTNEDFNTIRAGIDCYTQSSRAQALDYASWVDDLAADRLSQIYEKFSGGGNLGEAFKQRFNTELEEESINQSHQIIIVAAELGRLLNASLTILVKMAFQLTFFSLECFSTVINSF